MTLLSDPREASGSARVGGPDARRGPGPTDRELLAAVRSGDASAYAALYELHSESVRRLARRLCRDQHEADDVVSEVFANTLRALQNGGGPGDEFGLYVLRSVRNTVTKLRTRTDTARATPSEIDDLDRPDPREHYHVKGDIEQAFSELPIRFQQVLWTTAVEGHTPTELAARGDAAAHLDPGAVASLSQRARKALGREYLRVRTSRPTRHPECNRVRGYLPGYVQHTTGGRTAQRIEDHLAACVDCSQIRDDMRDLNGKLRTTPWMALFAAAVRRVAMSVASAGTPAAATAAAAPVIAIAVAGTMIARHDTDTQRHGIAAVYAEAEVAQAVTTTRALPTTTAAPAGAADRAAQPAPVEPAQTPSTTPAVWPEGTPLPPPETTATTTPGTTPQIPPLDPTPPGGPSVNPPGGDDTGTDDGAGGTVEVPRVTVPNITVPPTAPPTAPPTGPAGAGGVIDGVLPPATAGVGTLLDDVDRTVGDVTDVVGALPGGVPAVLDETGQLVNGVGNTLNNTLGTVGNVAGGATETLGATVTTLPQTVDQALTDVGEVLTIDPNAPVTDTVGDTLDTAGNLLGGVLGTPPATTPTQPVCLLPGLCL